MVTVCLPFSLPLLLPPTPPLSLSLPHPISLFLCEPVQEFPKAFPFLCPSQLEQVTSYRRRVKSALAPFLLSYAHTQGDRHTLCDATATGHVPKALFSEQSDWRPLSELTLKIKLEQGYHAHTPTRTHTVSCSHTLCA